MKKISVLIIHNAYQQFGGEDSVVEREASLLKMHGNLSRLHIINNHDITGIFKKITTAVNVIFSIPSYRAVRKLLREVKPDVVHVHNFFPLLSPSVFYACHAEQVPVVFTLHNYRTICPTALLMHDGRVTERSLKTGPWWALKYRTYKHSWIGTFLLCLMIATHKKLRTWTSKVDVHIVLTEFARSKFSKAGFPLAKMVVKPNFVDHQLAHSGFTRAGLLFVGRLSPEKGINTLLDATSLANLNPDDILVAGDGPLLPEVSESSVTSLGQLKPSEVQLEMRKSAALLLPSLWYEGFPMVLVEAYACGLPVIASRIGALAELVEDGVTGLLFEPGDPADLADKMQWALRNPSEMERMGKSARRRFEERYTPQQNYQHLMLIYEKAIRTNRQKRSTSESD